MSAKNVEFLSTSGLTLTIQLYPFGSDSIANGAGGDSATEATNRKGLYSATIAEAISGLHTAHWFSGSTLVGFGYIYLLDVTATYQVVDVPFISTSGVLSANVTQLLGTAWLTPGVAGTPDVNAKQVGGTAQTARDLGVLMLPEADLGAFVVAPGTTSLSILVRVVDDSGNPVTGLNYTTLPTTYTSTGATSFTTIALATLIGLSSAYSSGGVKEMSNGYYRLDVPNSALTSAARVRIFGDATNKHIIAPLIDVQYPQVVDSSGNAVAPATATTAIAAYIDTEVAAIKAKTDLIPAAPAATGDIPTAAANADAIWDELLSGHTTTGSAGKKLSDSSGTAKNITTEFTNTSGEAD